MTAPGGLPAPGEGADAHRRRAAFERHVVPELAALLHVARALTLSEHDAEDLVQDTLVRAYRAIDRFDGRHPRAWLFTIMRNAHASRNRRRRPQLLEDPGATDCVEAGASDSPERIVEQRLLLEAVMAALSKLPQHMAVVLELVDLDGLSYREAATALGVPLGTVMSRLHRARRRIRGRLLAAGLTPRGPRE